MVQKPQRAPQTIYVMSPDMNESSATRRTRLFLADGTELDGVASIAFSGTCKLIVEFWPVNLVRVDAEGNEVP
jgi:hypothetical protein